MWQLRFLLHYFQWFRRLVFITNSSLDFSRRLRCGATFSDVEGNVGRWPAIQCVSVHELICMLLYMYDVCSCFISEGMQAQIQVIREFHQTTINLKTKTVAVITTLSSK